MYFPVFTSKTAVNSFTCTEMLSPAKIGSLLNSLSIENRNTSPISFCFCQTGYKFKSAEL